MTEVEDMDADPTALAEGARRELTLLQGTQAVIEGVRVGVMIAALRDGVPAVRLLVSEPDQESRIVDLEVGRTTAIGDLELTVVGIDPTLSATAPGSVSLEVR